MDLVHTAAGDAAEKGNAHQKDGIGDLSFSQRRFYYVGDFHRKWCKKPKKC